MLEGLLESLLLHRLKLGDWIDGLSRDRLKLDIWSGTILLTALQLRPQAFAPYLRPFGWALKFGHIEELRVEIPWKSLQSSPVRIRLKGLYILLANQAGSDEDGLSEDERGSALKQLETEEHLSRIATAESLRSLSAQSASGAAGVKQGEEAGFAEQLLAKILANLEVQVDSVHVRVEQNETDSTTTPIVLVSASAAAAAAASPPLLSFALGLSIGSFSATTTNAAGEPHFVSSKAADSSDGSIGGVTHKRVLCSDVAAYCNPATRSWAAMPPKSLLLSFSSSIARDADAPANAEWWRNNAVKASHSKFSFLLLPLSPRLNLVLNRIPGDTSRPYLQVKLSMVSLPVSLTSEQCSVMLTAADALSKQKVQARQELLATIAKCKASKPLLPPFGSAAAAAAAAAATAAAAAASVANRDAAPSAGPAASMIASASMSASMLSASLLSPSMLAASVVAPPPAAASAQGNCKQWWRWAVQCVTLLSSVRRARSRGAQSTGLGRTLNLLQKAGLFRRYVPLYKRTLGVSWHQPLSVLESAELRRIETALEVKDVMSYRSLADAELRAEASNHERLLQMERAENAKRGYAASWYGYFSGSDAAKSVANKKVGAKGSAASSSSSAASGADGDGIELTAEQRAAILEVIGTPSAAVAIALPPDYIQYALDLDVGEATVLLRDSASANESRLRVFGCSARMSVFPLAAEAAQGSNPAQVSAAVMGFELEDRATGVDGEGKFPRIAYSSALQRAVDPIALVASASSLPAPSSSPAFFNLSYHRYPSDNLADHRLHIAFGALHGLLNPVFLARLMAFTAGPKPSEAAVVDQAASASAQQNLAASVAGPSALRSLASAMRADMQSEFVRSLSSKRRWDLSLRLERFEMRVPRKCASDAKRSHEGPVLVISTGALHLRSHPQQLEAGAAGESKEQDDDSGSAMMLVQRNLPSALREHPTAFDRFSLGVERVALQLCDSMPAADGLELSLPSADAPSTSNLFLLSPLSLELSLHLCIRLRLTDVHGEPLLLPRAVLSAFLPDLQLQVSQRALAFAASWMQQAKLAFSPPPAPAAVDVVPPQMQQVLNDGDIAAKKAAPVADAAPGLNSPPPSAAAAAMDLPGENVSDAAVAAIPATLPRVRTQFHSYFGIGALSLTLLAEGPSRPESAVSSSSAPSVALLPLLRVSGQGCDSLFVASSHESHIRLGLESVLIEDVQPRSTSATAYSKPLPIASLSSRHLAHAPGGSAASTMMRSPSVIVGGQDGQALQLRVITLMGAALHTPPIEYANRPAADQYVDAHVSCIQLNWQPVLMLQLQQWFGHIRWPKRVGEASPAPAAEAASPAPVAEQALAAAPASSFSSSSDSASLPGTPPARFLSLLSTRIDELAFRCLEPVSSFSSSSSALSGHPRTLALLQLKDLHLKQGVYERHEITGKATDSTMLAGIRELSITDATSEQLSGAADDDPYAELLSCRIDATEQAEADRSPGAASAEPGADDFDGESFDFEEEKKDDQGGSAAPGDMQASLPPHLRQLLPAAPYPLLFSVDSCAEGSKRFRGVESSLRGCIRGVSAVYVRDRIDLLLYYCMTGALGDAWLNSKSKLSAGVGGVMAQQRVLMDFALVHPTIIVPRSCKTQHRGQHVRADLGLIEMHLDCRMRAGGSIDSPTAAAAAHADTPPVLPSILVSEVTLQISHMNLTCPFGVQAPAQVEEEEDVVVSVPGGLMSPPISASAASRGPPAAVELVYLIRDVTFKLDVTLHHPQSAPGISEAYLHPHSTVRGRLSDFVLRLTRVHYLLLQHIAFDNLTVGAQTTVLQELSISLRTLPPQMLQQQQPAVRSVESKEVEDDDIPHALTPASFLSMSTDVQLQLDRLRVEMLIEPSDAALASSLTAAAAAPAVPTLFAAAWMSELQVTFLSSDERGALCTVSTKQMNIADCRSSEQRTIFYPLPPEHLRQPPPSLAASSSASAVPPSLDEMCVRWSRSAAAFAQQQKRVLNPASVASEAPIPDRCIVTLSHPCVLMLPDFWLRMLEFTAPEQDEDRHRWRLSSAVSKGVNSPAAAMRSTSTGEPSSASASSSAPGPAVSDRPAQLTWLDLHVSLQGARAVWPQTAALDSIALISTLSLTFVSTNAPASASSGHSQDVELLLEDIAMYGGSVSQPLVNNQAHRIMTAPKIQANIRSVFSGQYQQAQQSAAGGAIDGESKNDAEAAGPASPRKSTSTVSLVLSPISLQLSYLDLRRAKVMLAYFQTELQSSTAAQQARLALLLSRQPEWRERRERLQQLRRERAAARMQDWTTVESERHRAFLLQQQEHFARDECVAVPQLLDVDEDHDADKDSDALAVAAAVVPPSQGSSEPASAPLLTFGWLQVVELKCVSVSLLLLNDLALLESEAATTAAADSRLPSSARPTFDRRQSSILGGSAPASAAALPLAHLCLVDSTVLLSRPRANVRSGSTVSTAMAVASIRSSLSLSAYDPAGVEWQSVIELCPYEIAVEWQTVADLAAAAIRKPSAPTASSSSSSALPLSPSSTPHQSMSVQIRAMQAQEIHVTDRLISTLLQLQHTYNAELEKQHQRQQERAAQLQAQRYNSGHNMPASLDSAPPSLQPSLSIIGPGVPERAPFAPFMLRNRTFNSLCCWVSCNSTPAAKSRMAVADPDDRCYTIVAPSEEQPILLPDAPEEDVAGRSSHSLWTYVSFQFGPSTLLAAAAVAEAEGAPGAQSASSFQPLVRVPVSKVGTLVYELQRASAGNTPGGDPSAPSSPSSPSATGSGVFVQLVISMREGSKLIEIKSMHSVVNSTKLPLELRLLNQPQRPNASGAPVIPALELGALAPGHSLALPLDEPGLFNWMELQSRPVGFGMQWSGSHLRGPPASVEGLVRRSVATSAERTLIVSVCKMPLEEEGRHPEDEQKRMHAAAAAAAASAHQPSFVINALARSSKHMAATIVSVPSGAGVPELDESMSGVMSYSRIQIELHPPLTLANLFLCTMHFQIRNRPGSSAQTPGGGGGELLAAGHMQPGEQISLHQAELNRDPMIRFALSEASSSAAPHNHPHHHAAGAGPASAVAAAPKFTWSDWVGLDQLAQRPLLDIPMQLLIAGSIVHLNTQIQRSSAAASASVSLSFLCPFWLNNQSGIPLGYAVCDDMFENERYLLFKWRPPSLPTDRSHFSDRSGSRRREPPHNAAAHILPPQGEWAWVDEQWTVEAQVGKTTDEGWTFALDFPSDYHARNGPMDAVRRRRWVRHRALQPLQLPVPAVSSSAVHGSADSSSSIFRTVRMYGVPSNQPAPTLSLMVLGSVMPPSAPIDLAHAATDTILTLEPPQSHRAAGVALQSCELAVHVDNGPGPFAAVKVLSMHARYQLHNHTARSVLVRQTGLDPRNPRFVSSIPTGAARPLQPWICDPPPAGPGWTPPPRVFGVHVAFEGSPWSMPFPIQRVGEFTVKFPVDSGLVRPNAEAGAPRIDPATDAAGSAMYLLRIRVELVRAVLHVHILPESSFLVQPSSLLCEDGPQTLRRAHSGDSLSPDPAAEDAALARRTGSLYRIDNRTKHKVFVQQAAVANSAVSAAAAASLYRRMPTALPIHGHTSALYAFDSFDLSLGSEESGLTQAQLAALQSVCVEVEPALTETEHLQQMEREFNGAAKRVLISNISFDEVGAKAAIQLPTTTAPPAGSTNAAAAAASPAAPRMVEMSITVDGATRVLVIREVNAEAAVVPAAAAAPRGVAPPAWAFNVDLQLNEINILLLAVGDLAATVLPPRPNATSPRVNAIVKGGDALTNRLRKTKNRTADGESGAVAHVQEVLFVQLKSLRLDYARSTLSQSVQLSLDRFQIDNPVPNSIFPVVCHSMVEKSSAAPSSSSSSAAGGNTPALLISIQLPVAAKKRGGGGAGGAAVSNQPLYLDLASAQLQPFRLSLDEEMMRSVASFWKQITKRHRSGAYSRAAAARHASGAAGSASAQLSSTDLVAFLRSTPASSARARALAASAAKASASRRMYYFRRLDLGPLVFKVTYTPVNFTATAACPTDPLRKMHASLGSMRPFLDCEDAKIKLSSFARHSLYTSLPRLQLELNELYKACLLGQSMHLLGRARAFGNPLGVLSSVRHGLSALVNEGSTSGFINHTTKGVSSGAEGLTSTIGGTLAKLSVDSSYQAQRASHLQADRPQTATQGVKSGAKHLSAGVVSGLTGLVSEPVRGAQSGGFVGALGGAGKGLLGLFVKPVTGAVDAVNKMSQGVRTQAAAGATNSSKAMPVQRVAPPLPKANVPQRAAVPAAAASSSPAQPRPASAAPSSPSPQQPPPASAAGASSSASPAAPAAAVVSPTLPAVRSAASSSASPSSDRMWRCDHCGCFNAGDVCVACAAKPPV